MLERVLTAIAFCGRKREGKKEKERKGKADEASVIAIKVCESGIGKCSSSY